MREIIFRGKRASDGKWIEGSLCTTLPSDAECYIISYFDEDIYYTEEEVIPETVGQYTGLNDSTKWEQLTEEEQTDWLKNHTVDEWNGKKIFEGDIIKGYGVTGKIDFKKKLVRWDTLFSQWRTNEGCLYGSKHCATYKIIGNIHDIPNC